MTERRPSVVVIIPRRDALVCAQYARTNDVITEILRGQYDVRLKIVDLADCVERKGRRRGVARGVARVARAMRQADVVHVVAAPWRYLPLVWWFRFFSDKSFICGPNLFEVYGHTAGFHPDGTELLDRRAALIMEEDLGKRAKRYRARLGHIERRLKGWCISVYEQVLTLSQYNREVGRSYGLRFGSMYVLPPAAPIDNSSGAGTSIDAGEKGQEKVILWVGALTRLKGFDQFLELIEKERRPGVHFLVAGAGPLRPLIEEACNERPDITYLGGLRREEVLGLYGAADLYIQTSTVEMMSTTSIEALRAGCPVLSSDLPGECELSRNGNMLFYKNGEVQSLVDGFRRALACLDRLQSRAAASAIDYRVEIAADWLVRTYHKLRANSSSR